MKALVLSGGGNKGAWQAGVISRLMADNKTPYDIICGVSVGALNGAFMAQGYASQDKISMGLVKFWSGLKTENVYKRWFPFGKIHGLWKPSVYNSAPLRDLVTKTLDTHAIATCGVKLRVGAVSLTTGRYRLFSESHSQLPNAILASSAFPGVFSPVEIDGELWSDGGVRETTPLKAAIDAGATEVDVVLCTPETNHVNFPGKANALTIAARALDLMNDEIMSDDIEKAVLMNEIAQSKPDVGLVELKLRIFRPTKTLSEDPFDFSQPLIQSMLDRGFCDASSWISYGDSEDP